MVEMWGQEAEFCRLAVKYFIEAREKGLGDEDCNAVYKIVR